MSALVKLDGATEIPTIDLRKVDALCIVQTRQRASALRSAQPSIEARLDALERIARTLGHPAGEKPSLR